VSERRVVAEREGRGEWSECDKNILIQCLSLQVGRGVENLNREDTKPMAKEVDQISFCYI
jgi:hypothetical protein